MIVLDTNVMSELMKPQPDMRVVDWLDRRSSELYYLTSVVLAELQSGIELLPQGKRKGDLFNVLDEIVRDMIEDRVLSFDTDTARKFAEIYSVARAKGVSVGFADCQIAASALVQGYAVATRDDLPFKAIGCVVINPWID